MLNKYNQILPQEDNQYYYYTPYTQSLYQPMCIQYSYLPMMTNLNNIQDNSRLQLQELIQENQYLKKQLRLTQPYKFHTLSYEELTQEVFKMLDFLMNNINISPMENIFKYCKTIPECTQKRALKYSFQHILTQYLKASKTKEEMVKFIIRKSMKQNRNINKDNQLKNNRRRIEDQLQEYSGNDEAEADTFYQQQMHKINLKNADLKKMNGTFISKLFSSVRFRQDYSEFLNNYVSLAKQENQNKITKYVHFIVDLINKDHSKLVLNYKRFPWLHDWILQSATIAQNLLNQYSQKPEIRVKKQVLTQEPQEQTHNDEIRK